MKPDKALIDTSVLVGVESGRIAAANVGATLWAVSVVTLGELRLGVLRASDPGIASRRLDTYELARRFDPLPIDEAVSDAWAELVAELKAAGRGMPINDSWIAATAIAHEVPLVTQDTDFENTPGLAVIRI